MFFLLKLDPMRMCIGKGVDHNDEQINTLPFPLFPTEWPPEAQGGVYRRDSIPENASLSV